MDKNRIMDIVKICAAPVLMVVLGLVLLFMPDSAVAVVTKALAWILILMGAFSAFRNLTGSSELILMGAFSAFRNLTGSSAASVRSWIWPVVYLLVGGYMLANPLTISNLIGRIFGLTLIMQGVQDLGKSNYGTSRLLNIVTIAAGVVLFVMPRALTNTVLGFAGLVLIAVGICNLFGKLGRIRQLRSSDTNIIDADE